MDVPLRLADLEVMHPRLLWSDIRAAAALVLQRTGVETTIRLPFDFQNVPGFGTTHTDFLIACTEIDSEHLERVRRTYEAHRIVEMAGIAIGGLALFYGGGHEIIDVSARGSAADYLVDESRHLLEIVGRSRRSDLEAAWRQKCNALAAGVLLCLCRRV